MELLPWRRLVALATGGAAVALGLVLASVLAIGAPVSTLLNPGADGPSAGVVAADFPGADLPAGLGHDGQQYYAVARSPMHLDDVADSLDRPRYRLQRPVFPVLAWALHPSGGGPGLVWALVVVGTLGLVLGGVATGAMAVRLGGPATLALLFPLVPGSLLSLRLGLADPLALAFAFGAVALSLSGRRRWAVVAGVLAVLTKESALLVLLGWALGRRDRRDAPLVVVPAAAAGALALALRARFPGVPLGVGEVGVPFGGLATSLPHWLAGEHPWAAASVLGAFVLGGLALVRCRGSVLAPALALQLVFLAVLDGDVLGLDANGSRAAMPAIVLGVVALAAQRRIIAGDPAQRRIIAGNPAQRRTSTDTGQRPHDRDLASSTS